MRTLLILNGAPYGDERTYNGLRLAHALHKRDPEDEITIFLMADAVTAAKTGQKTPEGYYNVELMLKRAISSGASILLCGSCMKARGLRQEEIIEGAGQSTMDALSEATMAADKVLVF